MTENRANLKFSLAFGIIQIITSAFRDSKIEIMMSFKKNSIQKNPRCAVQRSMSTFLPIYETIEIHETEELFGSHFRKK